MVHLPTRSPALYSEDATYLVQRTAAPGAAAEGRRTDRGPLRREWDSGVRFGVEERSENMGADRGQRGDRVSPSTARWAVWQGGVALLSVVVMIWVGEVLPPRHSQWVRLSF